MAGDWIKMRVDLRDDPAVISISDALGLDPDTVVGKLHRLWSWATGQLRDGNATGVTESWVDRYISVTGFARAMQNARWLVVEDGRIAFPNWESHLSKGAKNRAGVKDRVAKHRNGTGVTKALPEKRREEKREETSAAKPPTAEGEAEVITKPKAPKPPPTPEQPSPEFLAWWAAWPRHPRKINKWPCWKFWAKNNLDPKAEAIMRSLERWKRSEMWTDEGGQFVPLPSTWLNQRRFNDMPIEAPHPVDSVVIP